MKVVVLGAGPAGMSAARKLSESGADVTVIDRHPFVGGAAASRPITAGGAKMDFGPHAFHLKNPEVNRFFLDHVGAPCPTKVRNERILVRGGLFRYPLQITDVLTHLSPGYLLWMGTAFAVARLRFRTFPKPDSDFEAWGINRFGLPLYEFTCGRYTQKIWGVAPSSLSAKLAQQKLKDLRLRDIISKLIGGIGQEHKQYWEDYIYPEEGIGTVFENMARSVEERSGRVILSAPLTRVSADETAVKSVCVKRDDGREEEIACDVLVNTIPLTHLARAINAGDSRLKIDDALGLKYRGLILINIVFSVDHITPYDWVYLLDDIFRCNRFTEQKNMGGAMIPEGKTVLCFELGASPGDVFWEADDDRLFQVALDDMRKINFIPIDAIEAHYVSRLEDAYPMYTLDFDARLDTVMQTLAGTKNLFTIGRQGLFLNNDVHDSMEMGMRVAENISKDEGTSRWYETARGIITGRIERSK